MEARQTGLEEAFENSSKKIVNCSGCTRCCEKGIVYVLPNETQRLKSLGVPLVEIDGINFIKRKENGACMMLDKENGRCSIYADRPTCCKAFPLDIFSRHGRLEWGVYTYCPPERILALDNDSGKMSMIVVAQLATMIEKHTSERVLEFLEKEDQVSVRVEMLDEYRNSYTILRRVVRRTEK